MRSSRRRLAARSAGYWTATTRPARAWLRGVTGRGDGGMPFEVAGEVRLVVKANGSGHIGGCGAPEHEAAGSVNAAAGHIGVRAQAELAGEAANQMRDAAV